MNLSAKHEQKSFVKADFTGGINTSAVPEAIKENQLSRCINMGLNPANGMLETVCGTAMIFKAPLGINTDCLFYDKVNNEYILVDMTTCAVYATRLMDMTGNAPINFVGYLTGKLEPKVVTWEDGLLIASGGKLQYWDGCTLNTISTTDAPDVCNGVFVKDGRVYVWYDYTLKCSAVGDEAGWEDVSNDDSTSKWVNIGYKEGENNASYIVGVINLSSDIIIIKADGKIYRMTGSYPDWEIIEVARQVNCLNRMSYCAVTDGVFILGRDGLFLLQTTQTYGDVQPANVAKQVLGLLHQLPITAKMRFIPHLNQLWISDGKRSVIVYDLNFNAFTQREFYDDVNDLCVSKDTVLLTRGTACVTRLMDGCFYDEEYSTNKHPINWSFQGQTITSFNDFFLKRIRVTYAPMMDSFKSAQILTANDRIFVNLPARKQGNKSPLIAGNNALIVNNNAPIFSAITAFNTAWCTYRDRSIEVKGNGEESAIILLKIEAAITEV